MFINRMAEGNQIRDGSLEAVNEYVLREDEEGGIRVDDDIYIPPPLKTINEIDVNGPRLMITKIVNENFKSYGGTQVIGPFHEVNIIV